MNRRSGAPAQHSAVEGPVGQEHFPPPKRSEILGPAQVYLVSEHDFVHGRCPLARPVVLVDAALAHLHAPIVELDLTDPPDPSPLQQAERCAQPIFAIDPREEVFYSDAWFGVVASDHRQRTAGSQPMRSDDPHDFLPLQ